MEYIMGNMRTPAKKRPAAGTPAQKKSILRDQLAVDRTLLALERTLLSYTRTAFILLSAGLTVLKLLSGDPFFRVTGIILLPLAVLVFVFGLARFVVLHRRLKSSRRGQTAAGRAA